MKMFEYAEKAVKRARRLMKVSKQKLNYVRCLNIAAKDLGFRNYEALRVIRRRLGDDVAPSRLALLMHGCDPNDSPMSNVNVSIRMLHTSSPATSSDQVGIKVITVDSLEELDTYIYPPQNIAHKKYIFDQFDNVPVAATESERRFIEVGRAAAERAYGLEPGSSKR